MSVLLKAGRREPSVTARCTALGSLAIYLYEELTHATMHDKMKDAIHILLSALKVGRTLAGAGVTVLAFILKGHREIRHAVAMPRERGLFCCCDAGASDVKKHRVQG